jgi:hypothetical protein
MLTYSELQAIDYSPLVEIKMSPLMGGDWPLVSVYINHTPVMMQRVYETMTVRHYAAAQSKFYITIMVEDPDTPAANHNLFATGIDFEGIWVDGQEVTAWVLQHSNMKLITPNQITAGSRWEFDSVVPFYHWLHKVSGQGWLLQPML